MTEQHKSTITVGDDDMGKILAAAKAYEIQTMAEPQDEETTNSMRNLDNAVTRVLFAWVNSEALQAGLN